MEFGILGLTRYRRLQQEGRQQAPLFLTLLKKYRFQSLATTVSTESQIPMAFQYREWRKLNRYDQYASIFFFDTTPKIAAARTIYLNLFFR